MDIKSFADFLTLAECESFSRAAALRNITQPAFSRRIQALETAVGAALIDRTGTAFKLTPAGKRFLTHARSLVALAETAVTDTQSAATHLIEPVYLVTPPYLSKTFFPAWYKTMQKSIPGLTMRISHRSGSAAIEELRRGLADFAMVLRARKVDLCYDFEGLETRVIGQDRMLAVCSKQTKDKKNLLMYERGSYMATCAETLLGKKASTKTIVFESASTGLLKEMALAGFGTAVLQESIVEDDLAQGYLRLACETPPLACDIIFVRGAALTCRKAEHLWKLTAAA